MLEKYLPKFMGGRGEGDPLEEENFLRIFALSSELLTADRHVVVTGSNLPTLGRALAMGDRSPRVTALESLPDEHAIIKNAGLVSDVRSVLGTRIEMEDESCDVLISCFSFLKPIPQSLYLREMARVIRPGGQCLLIEPAVERGSALKPLQKLLGIPLTDLEPTRFADIKYYSEAYLEWKMPYRFSFGVPVNAFVGSKHWV